jgi:hypothetical protein
VAVALVGTMVLEWGQWVDIAQSGYRQPVLSLAGTVGGALIFGFGAWQAPWRVDRFAGQRRTTAEWALISRGDAWWGSAPCSRAGAPWGRGSRAWLPHR